MTSLGKFLHEELLIVLEIHNHNFSSWVQLLKIGIQHSPNRKSTRRGLGQSRLHTLKEWQFISAGVERQHIGEWAERCLTKEDKI